MLNILWIVLGGIAGVLILFVLLTLICFVLVFYVPTRTQKQLQKIKPTPGKIYKPYHDRFIESIKLLRSMPCKQFEIMSFDGLILRAKYYETKKGVPIELMMHGYRGSAESDLCEGVQRCFKQNRNALLVDQRASRTSDGNIISFGVNEKQDCKQWIDLLIKEFGPDVKIILTGISMGAATVLLAAGDNLPNNVVGVIADCGYTSAEQIIKKVIKQLHLPVFIFYPLINLGAKVIGGFDLSQANVEQAVKNCKVPIVFFHGNNDGFVPVEMTKQNYQNCNAEKTILLVDGADHGLSYVINPEQYLQTLSEFTKLCGIK